MTTIEELEKRIEKIEERNRSVETNKAWETSIIRRVTVIVLTYITISIFLTIIHVQSPWINAIVPATGFFLSTLTLQYFKKYWMKHSYKK